jgi:hypothetical protein
VTLTPDFGLAGGVGYGLIRGLSINAGLAWIRVDALRKGDEIGQAPDEPREPFRTRGKTQVVFLGFGYNF